MVEFDSEFEEIKNEVLYLFNERKTSKVKQDIKYIMYHYEHDVNIISMLCELIGALLMVDSRYFMKKLYKSLNAHRTQYFSQEQIIEIDRCILSKYCLFEGEEIKYTVFGRIENKHGSLRGHHFFTNHRIISQGTFSGSGSLLDFLIGGWLMYATGKLQKRQQFAKQQKKIESSTGATIPEYGYQFPYEFLEHLDARKLKLILKGRMKEKVGDKIKTKPLSITIFPFGTSVKEVEAIVQEIRKILLEQEF